MPQRVTIAPLEDSGRVEGLIVTVEDVTARHGDQRSAAATLDDANWRVRNTAVREIAQSGASETIAALLHSVREHHHNLGLLNSALKVLALTNVDTHSTLVEFLQSPDADLRMQAALALGLQKDTRAIPALMRALNDSDANVVYHAIEALGALRAREACDALLAIAKRREFYLAFPAIEALGELGDSRVAPDLVPLLQVESLREPAAQALAKVGDDSTVPALVALLNEPGPAAEMVAGSLVVLFDRYERTFGEGRYIADLVRRGITASGIQNLLDALAHVRPLNLRALVVILGWLKNAAAARALALHLGSPDLRNEIIQALVRHGAHVTDLLIEQLKSEDLEIRWSAITALGRIRDARAAPLLARRLGLDPELTIPTIAALASIGDAAAVDGLLRLMGHPDAAVRRAAVGALNTIAPPDQVRRMLPLLKDSNPLVRESAVRIAGYFGYPEFIDAVLERCHDEDERVRRAAVEHLPFIEDGRVPGLLTTAIRDESPGVRAIAARALAQVEGPVVVPALIDALRDQDSWVRYFAARSLGASRSKDAAAALETLARSDPFPQVRIAAFEALVQVSLESAASVAALFAATGELDTQRSVAGSLKYVQDINAAPFLRDVLRSPHAAVRATAATALGERGNSDVVDILRELAMTDTSPDVIHAAVFALRSLPASVGTPALIDVLSDTLRTEAASEALTDFPRLDIDALKEALISRSVGVRLALMNVLERSKHPRATELLQFALEDAEPAVREAASATLSRRQR
jgi:HEAT repeat protein